MSAIRGACDPVLETGVENVVVLGTGGSIQTMLALAPFAKKRFVPLPSSRPSELAETLRTCPPETTCVVPISRGGVTLDVNSVVGQFEGYKFVSLASRGPLYEFVKGIGGPVLDVPDLSGRFAGSCTNVGLVPAYLCGVDVEAFVDGLELGYAKFSLNVDPSENESLQMAAFLYQLHEKGYRNAFSMHYSSWLEGTVGLFVQEVSESTGKDGRGVLGTAQPAPLCQHSVLELLLGGSKGHTVPIIWATESDPDDLPLRSPFPEVTGRTAHEVVSYQADATFQAILERGVPAAKVQLGTPSPQEVGELVAFVQNSVYFLCCLLDVNWSSNPLVVRGKEICNEALTRRLTPSQRVENRRVVSHREFSGFWA